MSTSVASVVSHFPDAENGFTTTLASTISSGAATVPLNSVAGYTNGEPVVLVIDPGDATKKQTFTGIVDTSGVQITSVVWTAGTNVGHTAGATVVDYATATHIAMISKGIKVHANQDGTLKTSAVQTALSLGASSLNGWNALGFAPNTVTALGNRSYSMVFNGNDLTSTLSAGMRLRTTRTVPAPTQSTSLNGTTQYYSKTSPAGMTFTDDFTVSAWIKLSSYPTGTDGTIVGRYNGTSGWYMSVIPDGRIQLVGFNGSSANFRRVVSYQSVPLNRWVHVAIQLDMSANNVSATESYIMLDGLSIPATAGVNGTSPTALVQAGNLEIGSYNGGAAGTFFPGKIAQVAIYSAKVTQATILASISQTLSGSETNLISAYSFNNTINDLNTTNANNLTANGSAVATNADSPYGGQADGTISSTLDYAIVQKTAFSTNTTVTVQVPEGCTIPTSGGVTSVVYSSNKAPYGMPVQSGKWRITSMLRTTSGTTSNATYGSYLSGGYALAVPIGEWNMGHRGYYYSNLASDVGFAISSTALTGSSLATANNTTPFQITLFGAAAAAFNNVTSVTQPQSLAAQTTYTMYTFGATTSAGLDGAKATTEIFAENALL